MRERERERAESMSREEKLARLRFTEADLEAFAFVPPGPDPVEVRAARGVEWAQCLLQTRTQHATHTVDRQGYCYACALPYGRPADT